MSTRCKDDKRGATRTPVSWRLVPASGRGPLAGRASVEWAARPPPPLDDDDGGVIQESCVGLAPPACPRPSSKLRRLRAAGRFESKVFPAFGLAHRVEVAVPRHAACAHLIHVLGVPRIGAVIVGRVLCLAFRVRCAGAAVRVVVLIVDALVRTEDCPDGRPDEQRLGRGSRGGVGS